MKYLVITGDSGRKERTKKRLDVLKVKYEIIEAVFPHTKEFKDAATCEVKRNGVFGCFRSHLKAMKYLSQSQDDGCIIVEDDMMFCQDFDKKANEIIAKNKDYNLILFSPYISDLSHLDDNKVGDDQYLIDNAIFSTGCYYIKKTYANHVLSIYDKPLHLYRYSMRDEPCDGIFTLQSGGIYIYPPLAVEECVSTAIDSDVCVVLKRSYWSYFGFENYGSNDDIQLSLNSCCDIINRNLSYFDGQLDYVDKFITECMKVKAWETLKRCQFQERVFRHLIDDNFGDCLSFFHLFSDQDLILLQKEKYGPEVLDAYCLALYYQDDDELIYPLGLLLLCKIEEQYINDNIKFYIDKAKNYIFGCLTFEKDDHFLPAFATTYVLSKQLKRDIVLTSNIPELYEYPYCPYLSFDTLDDDLKTLDPTKNYIVKSHQFPDAKYHDELCDLLKIGPANGKVLVHVYDQGKDKTYYDNAMKTFKDTSFVIFSDDITWCKENIKGDNITYHEEKETSGKEFFLMSTFSSYILCHSPKGWWVSWFSRSKDKKICLPANVNNFYVNTYIAITT